MDEVFFRWPLIAAGSATHIGLGRTDNEDALLLAPGSPSGASFLADLLWAVADGMGGHAGGKMASRLACRGLRELIARPMADPGDRSVRAMGRHLAETVLRVDRRVRREAAAQPGLAHMGTTLSCLMITDDHSLIAHVGDSRIYRWRSGRLTCLTTDHTFVQEMIFEGELDPESARRHPLRHMLTRAVGTAEPLDQVDSRIDRLAAGDRFLLCTDGLTNVVADDRLAAIMARDDEAGRLAEALVAEALANETRDNVTALVVRLG